MRAAVMANFYSGLAVCILFLHALFILWVVFGALLTRSRPVLRWLHIISLVWGIFTELLPWPCPLTLLENCWKPKPELSHTTADFCSTTWINSCIPTSPRPL